MKPHRTQSIFKRLHRDSSHAVPIADLVRRAEQEAAERAAKFAPPRVDLEAAARRLAERWGGRVA